jgi:hypothetical protein
MLGYRDIIRKPFDSSIRMAHFEPERPQIARADAENTAAFTAVDRKLMIKTASLHEVELLRVANDVFSRTVIELRGERVPILQGRRQAVRSDRGV